MKTREQDNLKQWRLIGSRFVCLILFLLVSLLAREVKAECGDYVIVGNPNATFGTSIDTFDGYFEKHVKALMPLSGHKLPCHGPSCKNDSTPKQSMTAPPVVTRVKSPVAIPLVPRSNHETTSEWGRSEQSNAGSFFEPGNIFRPPRFTA